MTVFFRRILRECVQYSMKKYTFKELCILAQYHLEHYRQTHHYEKLKEFGLMVKETNDANLKEAYYYSIKSALEYLTVEEKRILHADYIEGLEKNWWMEFYSKTSYYRIKYAALKRFINCLHFELMV